MTNAILHFSTTTFEYLFKWFVFFYPEETSLSNYSDDNTLHSVGNTIENVKEALRDDFRIIGNWFHENVRNW